MELLSTVWRRATAEQPVPPTGQVLLAGALALVLVLAGSLFTVGALQTDRTRPVQETERTELVARIQGAESDQDALRRQVDDLTGKTPAVVAALWRFCLHMDLVTTLKADHRGPGELLGLRRLDDHVGVGQQVGLGLPQASAGARCCVHPGQLQLGVPGQQPAHLTARVPGGAGDPDRPRPSIRHSG